MLTFLVIAGLVALFGGFIIALVGESAGSGGVVGVGVIFLVAGLVTLVVAGFISKANLYSAQEDRARRTIVVTDDVVEADQPWTKEKGCVQVFTIRDIPFTFELECSAYAKLSAQPPRVGDMMKVTFVRPKQADGKPEVLDVYNLTQVMEEKRSASSPSTPEAPPAE